MPILNGANNIRYGVAGQGVQVLAVYQGRTRVWPPAIAGQPKISNVSSAGTLTVTWPETENASSYKLYRNGILIATQSSRVYNDSNLNWNQTVYYFVVATVYGSDGEPGPATDPITIPKGTVGALSASSKTYTKVTVSWSAVPGATSYNVLVNGAYKQSTTSTSSAVSTSADTTIKIEVQPKQSGVYGNRSDEYYYYSGRAEVRDSGSKTGMEFTPDKVDSWRSADDWAWLSNTAAQGYYTSSYGSYRGVIYYGSDGVRGELRSKLGSNGTNRQDKGSCTKAELYLYKEYAGVNAGVKTTIYRSNSAASGDAPSGTGGVSKTTAASGSGSWINIGTSHGQALGDGSYKSLMTRQDGSTYYAQFTNCKLKLSWSWDYVLVSAKSNSWST